MSTPAAGMATIALEAAEPQRRSQAAQQNSASARSFRPRSPRLSAASEKVLQRATEELRKNLPVSRDEFEALVHLLALDLDLSISRMLETK